jgi:hypothetical protein
MSKGGDTLKIFWGEKREWLSLSRAGPLCGLPHVIEKGSRICIPLVYLVPKTGGSVSVDVTADQGSFSRTCWAGNPDDGSSPHAVQERKQAFPWVYFGEDRTSDFAHD